MDISITRNIGIQADGGVNGLLSVISCADNVKVLAELPPDAREHNRMIICQQQSNFGHVQLP